MKFNHRMMLLGAIAMAADYTTRTLAIAAVEDAQRSGKWDAGYAHTWTRRRKLKRSRQNHQRNVSPSRRHAA